MLINKPVRTSYLNIFFSFALVSITLGIEVGLAATKVAVIPLPGSVVTVPASTSIVADTPGRGNYQTSPSAQGVVDLTTGLEWTKRRSFSVTWVEAVEYCSELSLDNRGKIWRLPEIDELITLYRFGTTPYIDNFVFLSSELSFWSNTIAARAVGGTSSAPDSRWIAYFTDTRPRDLIEPEFIGGSGSIEHYARCVTNPR